MKILMLVPFLPNTSMSGGQTRWYNIIKHLSKNHDITLFSLIKDESEKKFIPELKKYCNKVEVFYRPKSPWTIRNLFLTAFSYYPLLVIRNFSLKEKKAIKKELLEGNYDLIHAETFYVMPHLLQKTKTPSILVEQTIEYLVYKHHVDTQVPFFLRPVFMIDVLKLKYWEKYYWQKTDRLVAVSETDKKTMLSLIPKTNVDVIPNGVDVDYFNLKKFENSKEKRILFVGNFKWLQNVEAAEILVNKLWPRINKSENIKLWIVGKSIPSFVKEAGKADKNILFTESIPDIRDAYKKSYLMLVPLYGPGGTRLKVLEALASSLPVVSTKIGVEGLGIKYNEHALVGESLDDLVKITNKLLIDRKLAKRVGKNGFDFVKTNYDWKAIVKLHDQIYDSVLK